MTNYHPLDVHIGRFLLLPNGIRTIGPNALIKKCKRNNYIQKQLIEFISRDFFSSWLCDNNRKKHGDNVNDFRQSFAASFFSLSQIGFFVEMAFSIREWDIFDVQHEHSHQPNFLPLFYSAGNNILLFFTWHSFDIPSITPDTHEHHLKSEFHELYFSISISCSFFLLLSFMVNWIFVICS